MDELDVEQFLKRLMAVLLARHLKTCSTCHLIYHLTNHRSDVDRGVRRFFPLVFL
jgi:hypothetical protein